MNEHKKRYYRDRLHDIVSTNQTVPELARDFLELIMDMLDSEMSDGCNRIVLQSEGDGPVRHAWSVGADAARGEPVTSTSSGSVRFRPPPEYRASMQEQLRRDRAPRVGGMTPPVPMPGPGPVPTSRLGSTLGEAEAAVTSLQRHMDRVTVNTYESGRPLVTLTTDNPRVETEDTSDITPSSLWQRFIT